MTLFIKGPWVAGAENSADGPWVVGTEIGGGLIARMAMPPCEMNEANANLIAAAPDMYEALEALMVAYEGCNGINHPAFVAAEKAMDKAEGRQ